MLAAGAANLGILAALGQEVFISKLDHVLLFAVASFAGQLALRALADLLKRDPKFVNWLNLGCLAVLPPVTELFQDRIGHLIPILFGSFQWFAMLADIGGGLLGMYTGQKVYEFLTKARKGG